ncbi:MAG: hypothetical protein QOK05_1203 [Chloroflexota bacterium]|nr:hypothetical protein [Chloroflexota bacterium]
MAGGFSDFFAQTYQQTLGLVAIGTGMRGIAEDATQEAYVKALDRWETVVAMSHPDRWVARVALNIAIDHLRKTARESELGEGVEATTADLVEGLWLRWNLDRLTPMQRAAMVRRYLDGMGVAEVARTLGRSPQTVKTHLRLARGRLRLMMAEDRR